jgi:hypothetical protein
VPAGLGERDGAEGAPAAAQVECEPHGRGRQHGPAEARGEDRCLDVAEDRAPDTRPARSGSTYIARTVGTGPPFTATPAITRA